MKRREYRNKACYVCGCIGRNLLQLPFHLVNAMLSLWKETTAERMERHETGPCYERYVLLTFATPILIILIAGAFVLAFFGLLVYLCAYRTRYRTSYYGGWLDGVDQVDTPKNHVKPDQNKSTHMTLSIMNVNTCLLPTFLAKFNNLSQTTKRAKTIAQILKSSENIENDTGIRTLDADVSGCIDFVPADIDFLCLQEVFERAAASEIKKGKLVIRGIINTKIYCR